MSKKKQATVSEHSIQRNSKRFGMHGWSRNKAQLLVDIRDGRTADDFEGRERKWLLARQRDNCTAYVNRGKCLILSALQKVVTVYPIPHWFNESAVYAGKEKVRNPRTYIKHHRDFGMAIV